MTPKLRFDPAKGVAHLRSSDREMAAVIKRVGPFALELKPAQSLFEALLRSIVYQQLHSKAASAIHGRVLALLDRHGGATPDSVTRVPEAALRSAGLSQAKLRAVLDLAHKCREGTVPTLRESRRLSDEDLVARLTQVRGIGPWTVHMLLIFYLGRPDVMPTGDFAIRLAFKRLYRKRRDPKPEAILKHSQRWHPYRSVAAWYLWRSLDTED